MKVVNLWIIYLVVLVGLGLILYVLVSKNNSIGFGSAAFFAALISGVIVYFVAQYNIDMMTLSKDEQNSLNALYITMGAVVLLGFVILVYSLASGKVGAGFGKTRKHQKVTMSDCSVSGSSVECSKTEVKNVTHNGDGSRTVEQFVVDERGVTPRSVSKRFADKNQIKFKYLV